MASWGKFGPSLEDVGVLTSMSLFRDAHPIGLALEEEDQKRLYFE